jgi:hypothetical protein
VIFVTSPPAAVSSASESLFSLCSGEPLAMKIT